MGLSYVLVFAALAAPWLKSSTWAAPGGHDPRDTRLIVWTLAWVARHLFAPTNLFNAPIYYPTLGQLATTEHLLAFQFLFLPINTVVGNALLATNILTFLTYPLTALLMNRLLVVLGLWSWAAWWGGLALALTGDRVPASFQILQYNNCFLPLLGLVLHRLRQRPDLKHAALFAASYLAALFSSYYLALIATTTAVVWTAFESSRGPMGRGAFLTRVGVTSTACVLALGAFSLPYFRQQRIEETRPPIAITAGSPVTVTAGMSPLERLRSWAEGAWGRARVAAQFATPIPMAVVLLALCGVVLGAQDPALRWMTVLGVTQFVIGALLMIGGWRLIPGLGTLLGFFRSSLRFRVMADFGVVIVAAAAVDAAHRRFSPLAGAALWSVASAALLLGPGRQLVTNLDEIRAYTVDASSYQAVGRIVRSYGDDGSLLEMPARAAGLHDHSPDAMIGSLFHGRPLLAGYAGYDPPVRDLYLRLFAELPQGDAIDDLVDLGRLRWILVRPADAWPSPEARSRFLGQLAEYPFAGPGFDIDGWHLRRIDRTPVHPDWFSAIAAGPRSGHSLLGTTLAPLSTLKGNLEVFAPTANARAKTSWPFLLSVRVSNRNDTAWPAAMPYDASLPGQVYIQTVWLPHSNHPEKLPVTTNQHQLRRDVMAGETLQQSVLAIAPTAAGQYDLELRIVQRSEQSPEPRASIVFKLPVEVESAHGSADR